MVKKEGIPKAPRGGRNPYSGNRFRKALRFFVAGRAAQAIATLGVTLVGIRVMSPTDYGAYLVLLGIVELCRPLSSLGLLPAIQQFLPELALHGTTERLRQFVRYTTAARFGLLLLLAAMIVLFWSSVAPWVGLGGDAAADGWIVAVLIVTLLGATFTDHVLEALLEQRFAQIVRALYPIGRLAGLIVLAQTTGATLQKVLFVDIAISIVCLVLAEAALVRQLRRLQPDGTVLIPWRDMMRFGWELSGSQVLGAFSSGGLLRIIVARVQSVTVAGQFGFLQQLMQQVSRMQPSVLFANLLRPMLIAARLRGDTVLLGQANGLLGKLNALIVVPMVAICAALGEQLTHALSGGRMADTGHVLFLTALAAVFVAQTQLTGVLLQVHRLGHLVRRNSVLALAAPVLVLAGAQVSLQATMALFTLAVALRSANGAWLLRRQVPYLVQDWRGLRLVLGCGVVSALVAYAVDHAVGGGLGRLGWLAAGAAAMLVYALLLLATRPFNHLDLRLVTQAAPRFARAFALLAAPRHN